MITTENKRNTSSLYVGLVLFLTISFGLWMLFRETLSQWLWTHDPVHAAAEVLGSMAAILVAFVLLQRDDKMHDFTMVAIGFICMGLLDGLHALTYPGVSFVFLHSIASLAGGLFFALVWLPQSSYENHRSTIVWLSTALAIVIGVVSIAMPTILPAMVVEGTFTYGAVVINITAGFLFLVSVPYFVKHFNQSGNLEYFMFLTLALLFGLAELTFQFSKLWDGSWWLWHFLRLVAYLITLWFVAMWYLRTAEEVLRSRDTLEQTVEERTIELERSRDILVDRVTEYSEFMAKVTSGDLTARLMIQAKGDVGNDPLIQLGNNLNQLITHLHRMINQIREATVNITSASAEILAAATQQATGANEQSVAINQTTATIREVKSVVEQAYTKAKSVAEKARQTSQISDTGRQAIHETVDGMSQIKERVASIAENILALSEQTQQIGEITATVNEIASQSNLLALNASVEAARAGEHGKGFAVVAVEVRNLAEQSKQATSQVKGILNEIQKATNAAVMATEQGTKGVDSGVGLTQQAGTTIAQLAHSIGESSQMAEQIVVSVQQQTAGMEQISLAIQNINQATMQSLASTQQTERSARDLATVSRQLEQLVTQYKLS
jgi:methyl-accepting chemotaxis protein